MKAQLYALLRMADTVYIDGYTATLYDYSGKSPLSYVSDDDDEPVIAFDDQEVELYGTCQATDKEGKQRTLSFTVTTPLDDDYLGSDAGTFNYEYWSKQ